MPAYCCIGIAHSALHLPHRTFNSVYFFNISQELSMALSSTTNRRITWALRLLLALAFGAAGAAKLAGAVQMIQVFDLIGIGQWFRYVTGVVEVAGAGLPLVPRPGFFWGPPLLVGPVFFGGHR